MHTHTSSHVCTSVLHCYCISSLNSLAQNGNTALLLAAYGGSVEVVRMLLEEYNCSLVEVNNVSVYLYYIH